MRRQGQIMYSPHVIDVRFISCVIHTPNRGEDGQALTDSTERTNTFHQVLQLHGSINSAIHHGINFSQIIGVQANEAEVSSNILFPALSMLRLEASVPKCYCQASTGTSICRSGAVLESQAMPDLLILRLRAASF